VHRTPLEGEEDEDVWPAGDEHRKASAKHADDGEVDVDASPEKKKTESSEASGAEPAESVGRAAAADEEVPIAQARAEEGRAVLPPKKESGTRLIIALLLLLLFLGILVGFPGPLLGQAHKVSEKPFKPT
jgi:hypothetical protein